MSMLKKIKSLFVVEDEQAKGQGKTQADKKNEDKKDSPSPFVVADHDEVNRTSINQFLEVLAEAMEKNNQEGYDYLEFKEALRSLEKIESDEQKKYITAYTLAKTMGAEKEALIKSANYYVSILQDEEKKFKTALKKQIDEKLTTGSASITNIEKEIAAKKETITKLEKEIETHIQKHVNMKKEVEEATNKVTTVQNSFNMAFEAILNQIKADLKNIENFIK